MRRRRTDKSWQTVPFVQYLAYSLSLYVYTSSCHQPNESKADSSLFPHKLITVLDRQDSLNTTIRQIKEKQAKQLAPSSSLRKHAYSNIQKISSPKTEIFQIKILIPFHTSAQNIDCGYSLEPPRRGGSNEYPQSMFLSRNKKNDVYPCKPQFYYIKVGFKGIKII